MTASPSDAWTVQEVADLEAWRITLCQSLKTELPSETTVEIMTYRDWKLQALRRFAIIYVGLTRKAKTEINYPEPVEDILARRMEQMNEHSDRTSEGTGRTQDL